MAWSGSSGSMALALAALTASAESASAQELAAGPATWSMVMRHVDQHPRSAGAARATLDRLGNAAMQVCGASSFSLREVQASVRASACWRDSMAEVVARIDDPLLTAAFRRHFAGILTNGNR